LLTVQGITLPALRRGHESSLTCYLRVAHQGRSRARRGSGKARSNSRGRPPAIAGPGSFSGKGSNCWARARCQESGVGSTHRGRARVWHPARTAKLARRIRIRTFPPRRQRKPSAAIIVSPTSPGGFVSRLTSQDFPRSSVTFHQVTVDKKYQQGWTAKTPQYPLPTI